MAVGSVPEFDVIIVGGGFSGCYLLYKLRQEGFKVLLIESADGFGGVWRWNCYPGARVDTHVPLYELSIPEAAKTWTWSQRFPLSDELVQYFEHLDKVVNLSKDSIFNTKVTTATFNDNTNQWTIITDKMPGTFKAKWFIPAVGFAAKRLYPEWLGLSDFKGIVHHSSFWPKDGVDYAGKRVGIVGTGSTGVQIAQEVSKTAAQLTVFQRTPNLALPLPSAELTPEEQSQRKKDYSEVRKLRLQSSGGYDFNPYDIGTFDHTPEEREAFYEDLWKRGGFLLWVGQYRDVLTDKKANRLTYDFWAGKIRAMINDPVKRDILAPLEPPHPFGTKRPSLFINYYNIFNQDNVDVVDIHNFPVEKATEEGLVTADGKTHKFDIIVLATGFDAITGSMKAIDIRNGSGLSLSDKWDKGTWTHLGLMTAGFPNMFFTYGPQAPTAFSNGPACVEVQGDWIVEALVNHRSQGHSRMEPTEAAEQSYRKLVNDRTNATLYPLAKSYYMGSNVEGKPVEALNFPSGIPMYKAMLNECRSQGYTGFTIS
jgi:cation diffusion facilitator CzcD-associated flavoprotein CzcO